MTTEAFVGFTHLKSQEPHEIPPSLSWPTYKTSANKNGYGLLGISFPSIWSSDESWVDSCFGNSTSEISIQVSQSVRSSHLTTSCDIMYWKWIYREKSNFGNASDHKWLWPPVIMVLDPGSCFYRSYCLSSFEVKIVHIL